ncbi:hypothetical protein WJX72_006731 [[Myrmecia] bisecta]|uniref:NADH dehydrogenase [ubiquinone] 1 beta subcomplex subunit 8, mitochondrial n=1 Tax=[Myrmecia] bisecta TaxID=41462 RepID=A0AAW1PSK6_9CHLO
MAGKASLMRGLARRANLALAPTRGGGGGPVALGRPVSQPLPEEDELLWDDGSAHPEWCLDSFDLVSKWEALGMLSAGFAVFGVVWGAAALNDKASKMPYAPREYPYDNLRTELGGDLGAGTVPTNR